MNRLRIGLPPLPRHMQCLDVSDKGYPIPWFVQRNADGSYDFRIMDGSKLLMAYHYNRCWVCGGTLGAYKTFVVGPMCVVNRASAEPPSHYECAKFSAIACPFLTLPKSVRREANLPENTVDLPGVMIPRNPGVTCLWTVKTYGVMRTPQGPLFKLPDAETVEWYAEKQHATREQIMASMDSGMEILRDMAKKDGPKEEKNVEDAYIKALTYVPPSAAVVSAP